MAGSAKEQWAFPYEGTKYSNKSPGYILGPGSHSDPWKEKGEVEITCSNNILYIMQAPICRLSVVLWCDDPENFYQCLLLISGWYLVKVVLTWTARRRKFLPRFWTSPIIYYWINYELLIIVYLYGVYQSNHKHIINVFITQMYHLVFAIGSSAVLPSNKK